MSDEKVVIYDHPNPEFKSFLLPEEVSPPRVERFQKPLDRNGEERLKRLGILGAQVVREIMAVPGVMEVWLKPNEIRVKKELNWTWEKIQGPILEIVHRVLRKKKIRIVNH